VTLAQAVPETQGVLKPLAAAQKRLGRPGRPRKVVTERPHPRVAAPELTGAGSAGQRSTITAKSNGHLPDAMPPTMPLVRPSEPPITPRLLDARASSRYLGVSIWTIRSLVASGRLSRVEFPGVRRWLVDRHDLDALVDALKAGPA